jgi:hypothetical protein
MKKKMKMNFIWKKASDAWVAAKIATKATQLTGRKCTKKNSSEKTLLQENQLDASGEDLKNLNELFKEWF